MPENSFVATKIFVLSAIAKKSNSFFRKYEKIRKIHIQKSVSPKLIEIIWIPEAFQILNFIPFKARIYRSMTDAWFGNCDVISTSRTRFFFEIFRFYQGQLNPWDYFRLHHSFRPSIVNPKWGRLFLYL